MLVTWFAAYGSGQLSLCGGVVVFLCCCCDRVGFDRVVLELLLVVVQLR